MEGRSVKKFIIDQGVLRYVSFHHVICEIFYEQPCDNHGDEDSHEDVACGHIENVDEIDGVHQENKFVTWHEHIGKGMPVVLEENGEFSDEGHVQWATD